MDESTHSFALWLRYRRQALHLTQRQLGDLARCSEAMIRKIEADERMPSHEVAQHLAVALQVPERDRAQFLRWARGEYVRDPLPQPARETAPERPLRVPTNLPVPPNALIGRQTERATVVALLKLPTVRLVTLTGTGGVGKTRLGIAIAEALHDVFVDGIFFVNLAPVSDPALVLATIAASVHVKETTGQSLLASLQAALRDRRLLLLLDNFEQVLDAGVVVADLLRAVPLVKVLVTSRASLRVQGEREVVVKPLLVPNVRKVSPELLEQYDATRLFVDRVRSIQAFEVTQANARAVVDICARLDGLPLAIELASARIKILPPVVLLKRLVERKHDSLSFLKGGARDLPERQQTLQATLDWSYNLLDAAEQRLFSWLAVFVGGWTLEAAEAVVLPVDVDRNVLDLLESLVDKHLVRREASVDEQPRFGMLQTIREYALERFARSEDVERIEQRHTSFFLTLIAEAEQWQGEGWAERFETERYNIRAVLRRALQREDAETVLKLSAELQWFWIQIGPLSEGRQWLGDGLKIGDAVASGTRAKATGAAGALAWRQGDYAGASPFLERALELFREVGDTESAGWMLCNLGKTMLERGDTTRAKVLIEEGLQHFRALAFDYGTAWALVALGEVIFAHGDYGRATSLLEEALTLFQRGDDRNGLAVARTHLAEIAYVQGLYDRAQELLLSGLRLFLELGFKIDIPRILVHMAGIANARHDAERAARLWGAAEALRGMLGTSISPTRVERYQSIVTAIRGQLEPTIFAARTIEGQAMTLEQAVAYVSA